MMLYANVLVITCKILVLINSSILYTMYLVLTMAGDFRLARGDVKRISFFHANGRFVLFLVLLTK